MKTTVFCQHVLALSKAIAKPHRTRRGDVRFVCCVDCSKLVIGPIADLVFKTAENAASEAKRKKIATKRLDLRLTIAKDGVTVTRMERKQTRRRVKPWKKPEITEKTIQDGPCWKVVKSG